MKLSHIRKSFLKFFEQNDHKVVPSSSVVPSMDPSLLFTNSGMVQFKNYFTKAEVPPFNRATTSQKCIRAGGKHNDLENVGYTARHHTFFEMLGNFSFNGSYFKEAAIEFSWKYLTEVLQLDKNKLYFTVYHTDDEAFNIWKKLTGLPASRIIRIATNDNFWSMGDTGPCGPCSEIFFDHGEAYQGGLPGTPEEGGDRYIEIWNLVFMQYEQAANGTRTLLPDPGIDTGMGLERITAVMQGVNDNYDTDLFLEIRRASQALSENPNHLTSHKVIADHLRSSCFLIADGVMPSNEGRGYVLRRIIRRALRHATNLKSSGGIMHKLVPVLVSAMSEAYPELKRAEAAITSTIKLEEEKFEETLDRGLKILHKESLHLQSGDKLDGQVAFTLYDTYGFPLDLTKDILRERNIEVDENSFEQSMNEQKARAKLHWSGSGDDAESKIWHQLYHDHGATEFLGYKHNEANARILAVIVNGELVQSVNEGKAIIVVDKTPFYAESGGQVGDIGQLSASSVTDVKKYSHGVFAHYVEVAELLNVGDHIKLSIDVPYRSKLRANHSAAHLLHKALRDLLGEQVTQKGSLITAEKLRFDFSHNTSLSLDELFEIEVRVNQAIMLNDKNSTAITTPQEAISKGAVALFGEKYGDQVRVVSLGEAVELCGGTHVQHTGDIGFFKILSEQSIASGIRRIEALTGLNALRAVQTKRQHFAVLCNTLKCSETEVAEKVLHISTDLKKAEKKITAMRAQIEALDANCIALAEFAFVHKTVEQASSEESKAIMDTLKQKYPDSVILLINQSGGAATLMCSVSGAAKTRYHANELLQKFAQDLKGKGGGTADLAQLGGCDLGSLTEFLLKMQRTLS